MILAAQEGPPVTVVNPEGKSQICLVCEHASDFIPASLSDLGLAPEHRHSHAVWDIGAAELARRMSEALDAPLVMSGVSRLVYDCNRPPDAPDAIPAQTETIPVPGNRALGEADRSARVAAVYDPFTRSLRETLDRFATPPALVTVHSFTPVWHGAERAVELGLLHDADERLAKRMLLAADPAIRTELNAPYSAADGVTHTLKTHAIPRGLENVMIEVRNDLLRDAAGVDRIAGNLIVALRRALAAGAHAA